MEAPTSLASRHDEMGLEGGGIEKLDHVHELERIEAALAGVEDAMARLDDGSYGTCTVCTAVLADPILEATPTARSCPDQH